MAPRPDDIAVPLRPSLFRHATATVPDGMSVKGERVADAGEGPVANPGPDMELFDIRVTVERIEGRSVCGLQIGDYFEVTDSNELRIPDDRHFCIYALQAVLPLIPAKQRKLPDNDWLEQDSLVCCPDPDERVVMRIERTGTTRLRAGDLT